jgi:hypothetical protein
MNRRTSLARLGSALAGLASWLPFQCKAAASVAPTPASPDPASWFGMKQQVTITWHGGPEGLLWGKWFLYDDAGKQHHIASVAGDSPDAIFAQLKALWFTEVRGKPCPCLLCEFARRDGEPEASFLTAWRKPPMVQLPTSS